MTAATGRVIDLAEYRRRMTPATPPTAAEPIAPEPPVLPVMAAPMAIVWAPILVMVPMWL